MSSVIDPSSTNKCDEVEKTKTQTKSIVRFNELTLALKVSAKVAKRHYKSVVTHSHKSRHGRQKRGGPGHPNNL